MRSLDRSEKKGARRSLKLLLLVLIGFGLLASLRIGGQPEVSVASDLPGIGPRTVVTAIAREPGRGVSKIVVELEQGGQTRELLNRDFTTRPPWAFWGPHTPEETVEVEIGTTVTEGLTSEPATVRFSAWRAGTWLRRPEPETRQIELPVRLTPPQLQVLSSQHYPTRGGAEAVVYRVSDGVVSHGVQVGDSFFPGYSGPGAGGSPGQAFAMFVMPYDPEADVTTRLIATDDVGHRAERSFLDRLRERTLRVDTINVPDDFIARVAPEIEAQTPGLDPQGSLLDRYLAINRELRVANRAEIAGLAAATVEGFQWRGAFLPMPNAQVMARFADRRTYRHGGAEVDRQDHLGYDLASVQQAEVPAANGGVVVRARFLGIYGNVVVLDHGYGLMSLYGHLSSIEVAEGDAVERGQTLGRTGATGLAGGDHLHFGVFLHGVATDPVEWLDEDWIRNRLEAKLGPMMQ